MIWKPETFKTLLLSVFCALLTKAIKNQTNKQKERNIKQKATRVTATSKCKADFLMGPPQSDDERNGDHEVTPRGRKD